MDTPTVLTPTEEALQLQVCKLPVIVEIIEDLDGLKEGQEGLKEKVDSGFAKGKERMDGLETMFEEHIAATKENHKEAMGAISSLNIEIKDNKIKDVVQESSKKSAEFKAYKEKVYSVVKTVVIGIFMLIAGGFVGKLFG